MKKHLHHNGAWKTTFLLVSYMWWVAALIMPILSTRAQSHGKPLLENDKDSLITNIKVETFQEIGFFGEVKKDQWSSFVQAVQNNISHSRREKGNLSFSLYQPEDDRLSPIWFERFKSKEDHNYHKKQEYFKNAIAVIQQSLAGEVKSIRLDILDEIPAITPKTADNVGSSHHEVVLFDVRPEKRENFIRTMASVTLSCRNAVGNLEYNLYGYTGDPNRFVLIEGWQSQADYEAQLKQGPLKKLNVAFKDLFATSPMDTHWVVKDISQ
jgi:quinol monooxygenase YgiN